MTPAVRHVEVHADVEGTLWTVAETAAYLRLSRSFVYKASNAGTLPCLRIGAAVRFDPGAVRAWAHGERATGTVVRLPGCR